VVEENIKKYTRTNGGAINMENKNRQLLRTHTHTHTHVVADIKKGETGMNWTYSKNGS